MRRLGVPRFDLRVRRGSCELELRDPVAAGIARLEALGIGLEVASRLELSRGAVRFRNHRSRVRQAVLSLRPGALLASGREEALEASFDGLRATDAGLVLAATLPGQDVSEGGLGVALRVQASGGDLLFVVEEVRWVRRGLREPWERILEAAARFGLTREGQSNVFRWRRPFRRALAEALMPHGWRVPDERGIAVDFSLEEGRLQCRLDASKELGGPVPWDEVPDVERSTDQNHALIASLRHGTAGPLAPVLDAIRDGDVAALEEAVGRLEQEPSSVLRGEAILEAAAFHWARGAVAATTHAVLSGLSLAPRDSDAWARWCGRFADAGWIESLRLADVALVGPLPRRTRARLAARAVEAVLEAGAELNGEDEARLERLVTGARALSPELPEVLAAQAALAQHRGKSGDALSHWREAARKAPEPEAEGHYRWAAAEVLCELEGPAVAAPQFADALELLPEDVLLRARYAEVLGEAGRDAEAEALFATFLERPPETDDDFDALLTAARYYTEGGHGERAKPFMAALGPSLNPPAPEDDPMLSGPLAELDAELQADLRRAFGGDLERLGEQLRDARNPAPGSVPPPAIARGRSSAPPAVTMVQSADDELRALLAAAKNAEEPWGLLEAALDEAEAVGDAAEVLRVIHVLDRLNPFAGEATLRERAERLRAELRQR